MVRKKARRRKRQEEDPMAGTTNLVDAILQLSAGTYKVLFLVTCLLKTDRLLWSQSRKSLM